MLALLALLGLSAFFSTSETALIGVPRVQVRDLAQKGSRRARLLDRMLDEPERVLTTVLIGNNLVNIGATAFATWVALGVFGGRGALIATGAMAVLVTVLSEIIPKTFAVQHSLKVALRVARPLRVVELMLKPLVDFLTALSRGVARLGGDKPVQKAPFLTTDEIEMIVRMGVQEGHVEHFEHKVIQDLFDFTETPVSKVMTAADKVQSLLPTSTLEDAIRIAARERRSRIVVADAGFTQILGFVHIKDLLRYTDAELARLPVTLAIRPVLRVPGSMRADHLLVRMQHEHRSMAVIQEGSRNLGIVTADDLVEELVGEIHDEFDAARRRQGPPAVHT
jgi:CBS domain containing-hemolysin-like protein